MCSQSVWKGRRQFNSLIITSTSTSTTSTCFVTSRGELVRNPQSILAILYILSSYAYHNLLYTVLVLEELELVVVEVSAYS
jgi:hypothetical protein